MDFSLILVPAQSRITLSLTFGMITEYTPDEHYTTHERWSIIFVNGGGFTKYSPSNNIVSRLYCVCIGSLSNVLKCKIYVPLSGVYIRYSLLYRIIIFMLSSWLRHTWNVGIVLLQLLLFYSLVTRYILIPCRCQEDT